MIAIYSIAELRAQTLVWKKAGISVALVPTMGNLHAGHLALVEEARNHADKVIVSVFVNPAQFGEGEDFTEYPRTESADKQRLESVATDILFLPSVSEMYDSNANTVVSVKNLSILHCGKTRAGHFDGVATIVCKLFNIVQPDLAFFGIKDFQQLVIIKKMVQDLNFPVAIRSVAIVREQNGLAMSSRNVYLTAEQLLIAPLLYKSLCQARAEILTENRNFAAVEQQGLSFLLNAGFVPEYFSICRPSDLQPAGSGDNEFVILAAARLGKTRLIDNVQFEDTAN